jgi:ferritin-like metal-binding protein YciE
MAEMATNADLKAGLKSHVIDTQNQIERLDKVFAKLGKQPKGTDSPAIDGLIKEANATAGEIEDKAVLDAAIVANSQAVEHYEISRYGTLIAWAEELGHGHVVRLLTTNLNEDTAVPCTLSLPIRLIVSRSATIAMLLNRPSRSRKPKVRDRARSAACRRSNHRILWRGK